MDDNIEDGFESEENYYAFLNIPASASANKFIYFSFYFGFGNSVFDFFHRIYDEIIYESCDMSNIVATARKRKYENIM